MSLIYVRTRPGRKAYFEGQVIPEDKFVPVTETPYIRRLIDHWGDLEVDSGSGAPPPPEPRRRSPPTPKDNA